MSYQLPRQSQDSEFESHGLNPSKKNFHDFQADSIHKSLGPEFENALTTARKLAFSFERPSTALSTTSDDSLVTKYAQTHSSFRPISVQPAKLQDEFNAFLPPKRVLPFPSLRKGAAPKPIDSQKRKLDPASELKPGAGGKRATTMGISSSRRIANRSVAPSRNCSTVAQPSNDVLSTIRAPTAAQSQIRNNSETSGNVQHIFSDSQAPHLDQPTGVAEPERTSDASQSTILKGRKRGPPRTTVLIPSPKRCRQMTDHSTQTQTNSGRDHTAAMRTKSVEASTRGQNQSVQQSANSPDLMNQIQEMFRNEMYAAKESELESRSAGNGELQKRLEETQRLLAESEAEVASLRESIDREKRASPAAPSREIWDTPGYHEMSDKDRHGLLNDYIFKCLEDPNFAKVCNDMDKVWRGKVLSSQDHLNKL